MIFNAVHMLLYNAVNAFPCSLRYVGCYCYSIAILGLVEYFIFWGEGAEKSFVY